MTAPRFLASRDGRVAAGIFAAALAVRLLVVFVLPPESAVYPDTRHYDQIAQHLVAGDGYVDDVGDRAVRLPTYPLFLAAHRALFGGGVLPVQLTQALLGAATCLLLWVLVRRLAGPGPAVVAGGGAAVYPLLVVAPALLIIETLFAFLLVLELLFLQGAARDGRPARAAAAGLAGGAATLIQSAHVLLFAFLLPLAWVAAPRKRAGILLAFLAGTAILPGIWTARNWIVLDAFVPLSTRAGLALDVSFRLGGIPGETWVMRPERTDEGELEYDPSLMRLAAENARRDVGRSLHLAVIKQVRLWSPVPNADVYRSASGVLLTLPFLPVLLLFLAGLVRLPRKNPDAMWLLVPVVYMAAVYFVFVGSIRYRLAVEPFLIGIAAMAAWDLGRAWRARRARSPAAGEAEGVPTPAA